MKTFVFITLTIFWMIATLHAQRSSRCETPDYRPGICINIRSCRPLLRLFSQKPLSTQTTQFLQNSQCGFEGNIPKVCCPESTSSSDRTPSVSPGRRPSVTSAVSPRPQGRPRNSYQNHRNRRFFPDYPKCGVSVYFERIVGGENALVGEFPWTALLGYTNSWGQIRWLCGGSLISEKYVLTAAHCINVQGATLSRARLGERTISEDPDCEKGYCAPPIQDVQVESTIVHNQYDTPRYRNDIALVRLRKRVTFTEFIQPICLPFNELATSNLENLDRLQYAAFVAGWGRTNFSNPSGTDILQKLYVPIVPLRKCSSDYKTQLELGSQQICAGGVKGEDSCRGDSGGPLMLVDADGPKVCFYAAGVVSIGPERCGESGLAGIYTRVGAYLTWILDNIAP